MGKNVSSPSNSLWSAPVLREIDEQLGPAFSPAGMDITLPRISPSAISRMKTYAMRNFDRDLAGYLAFVSGNPIQTDSGSQGTNSQGTPAGSSHGLSGKTPTRAPQPGRPTAGRPRSRLSFPLQFDAETVVPKLVAAAYAEEAAERLGVSQSAFMDFCEESFLGKSAAKGMRRVLRLLQTRKGIMVLSNVLALARTPLASASFKNSVCQIMLPAGALFSQIFVVPGAAERLAPVVFQYVVSTFEKTDLQAAGKVSATTESATRELQCPDAWLMNLSPAQVFQLANSELQTILLRYVVAIIREVARLEALPAASTLPSGTSFAQGSTSLSPAPSASVVPSVTAGTSPSSVLFSHSPQEDEPPGFAPRIPAPERFVRRSTPQPGRIMDIMDFFGAESMEDILSEQQGLASDSPGSSKTAGTLGPQGAAETVGYVVLLSHIFDNIVFALRDHSLEPKPALAEFLIEVVRSTQELPDGAGRELCLSSVRAIAQAVQGRIRPCEQLMTLEGYLRQM